MANDDAWQAGVDIAQKHMDNKKKPIGDKAPKKKGGGLFGKIMHVVSPISNFHKGGKVKKTGPYILKKGEHVITAKQAKTHHRKNLGTKATKKRVTKR